MLIVIVIQVCDCNCVLKKAWHTFTAAPLASRSPPGGWNCCSVFERVWVGMKNRKPRRLQQKTGFVAGFSQVNMVGPDNSVDERTIQINV